MAYIMKNKTKLVAGLIIGSGILCGAFAGSAGAEDRRDEHRRWNHQEERYHDRDWGRGYYAPPPVIYAPPAYYAPRPYYPPPVVYGPSVGVYLPGVSIGIH
jgi:hypothetical protein